MDLIHNNKRLVSLPAAVYSKAGGAITGAAVDTSLAERVLIEFGSGALGTQVNVYTLELVECDTIGGTYTPVADAQLIPISGAEAAAQLEYHTSPTTLDESNTIKTFEYVGEKLFLRANLIAPTGAGTGSGIVWANIILFGLRHSVLTP